MRVSTAVSMMMIMAVFAPVRTTQSARAGGAFSISHGEIPDLKPSHRKSLVPRLTASKKENPATAGFENGQFAVLWTRLLVSAVLLSAT